jgi:hypothetical protein
MAGCDTIRIAASAGKVIVIVWQIPPDSVDYKEAPVPETVMRKTVMRKTAMRKMAMTETPAGQCTGKASAARSYGREAAASVAA